MLPDSWTTAIAILAAAVFVTPPVPEQMAEAPVKNDGSARGAKVEDEPRSNIPKSRCKSKKCAVIPWVRSSERCWPFFLAARKGKLDPGAKQKSDGWTKCNQNGCRCSTHGKWKYFESIMKFPVATSYSWRSWRVRSPRIVQIQVVTPRQVPTAFQCALFHPFEAMSS